MNKMINLALADGTVFKGRGLIDSNEVITGEVVFSTSTTGYTEVLSDPSYYGQIVVLANPEIGNYGVHSDDFQSSNVTVKALVVRSLSLCASSFRAQMTLADWLMRERVPVVFGLDTRAIIAHVREAGAMMASLTADRSIEIASLISAAKQARPMEGMRLSSFVAVKKPVKLNAQLEAKYHVVVMDFGVKRAILDCLEKAGAELTLIPPDRTPEEIWALHPDGLFLSNGPGDPKTEKTAVSTVRTMLGKVPIFGVCLGHQILAQALGYETYKLKFGHRGSNQAVKDGQRIIITAQNHGFAVGLDGESKNATLNIADKTNEGLDRKDLHAFSVQFHPEGAPGPHDAVFYFEKFMSTISDFKYNMVTIAPTINGARSC